MKSKDTIKSPSNSIKETTKTQINSHELQNIQHRCYLSTVDGRCLLHCCYINVRENRKGQHEWTTQTRMDNPDNNGQPRQELTTQTRMDNPDKNGQPRQ